MNFAGSSYEKTKGGHFCSDQANEIQSEAECKIAAEKLDLQWDYSWTGQNDFPACLYAEGGRNKVYFNLSPNPSRNPLELPSNSRENYSAICKIAGKIFRV